MIGGEGSPAMIVRELSAAQCFHLVDSSRLARLACSDGSQPYVISIFYAYGDSCAYAFTMPGRKLDLMRANPRVALLVEESGHGRGWRSVVAEGRFEELPDRIGHKRLRDRAWTLLSRHVDWWEPGALKPVAPAPADHSPHVFFRIHVERMTGREAIDE
jgi:nitroimidazol reductase NimA-like FMN-containing flavoprotein (pyridoxamine 5'-phosphate oxidase superfamily)